ncbi:MAG: pentapeptide repeat-containing protein, partial [Acidimicrobiales bacterium]
LVLSGSGSDGDGSATGGEDLVREAPTSDGDSSVVVDGYIPPTVDDPLDPPAISGFGANPLMLAFDHESGRIAQCPDGLVRDLSGQDLSGVDWSGRDLRCTDFRGATLTGADLSGALMWGSDFTGLDLTGVELGSEGVQFQAAVLAGSDLSGLSLPNVDWSFADLSGANLEGAELTLLDSVVLSDTTCPDGTNSDDTRCGLGDGSADSASVEGPIGGPALISPGDLCPDELERPANYPADGNLSGRSLTELVFECVDLSGADLSGAMLDGSSFIGVDLTGADLSGASFTAPGQWPVWRGVNLTDTNLDGITLHARLYGVDLRGVDFGEANLSLQVFGSIVDGMDVSEAIGADAPPPDVSITGSSAVGAILAGANVNLDHTDAGRADLSGATFTASSTSLVDADLDGATLFEGFHDVDMTGASSVGATVGESVTFTSNTICPDGSRPDDNLGVCLFG